MRVEGPEAFLNTPGCDTERRTWAGAGLLGEAWSWGHQAEKGRALGSCRRGEEG